MTGATVVNTSTVNTSGIQTYDGEVTLGTGVIFTAGSDKLIYFKDAVHGRAGTETLEIATADSKFDGIVDALSTLTTGADTNINCASITTTGAQVYNGVITVSKDTTLTANGINYSSNISGTGKTLTIDTPDFNSTKTGEASSITLSTLKLARGVTLNSTTGINLNAGSITQTDSSDFA
ncbi:MAG: hypothetical protein IKN54_03135, partial [Lachnospiraceae bacterium]|nr:hypothetical protein [Lachnospiraceae bacterium]